MRQISPNIWVHQFEARLITEHLSSVACLRPGALSSNLFPPCSTPRASLSASSSEQHPPQIFEHHQNIVKMVCAKCEKAAKSTTLATPGVKKKSEMYYGSSAGSGSKSGDKKPSATLGNNGIGKVSSSTTEYS